jgi:hypothetical protein
MQVLTVDLDLFSRDTDFAQVGGNALFETERVNEFGLRRCGDWLVAVAALDHQSGITQSFVDPVGDVERQAARATQRVPPWPPQIGRRIGRRKTQAAYIGDLQQQSAALGEHVRHRREGTTEVFDMHEQKPAVHPVNLLAPKWIVLDTGLHESDVATMRQIAAGYAQLLRRGVNGIDHARVADACRDPIGDPTVAASQVDHAITRLHAGGFKKRRRIRIVELAEQCQPFRGSIPEVHAVAAGRHGEKPFLT